MIKLAALAALASAQTAPSPPACIPKEKMGDVAMVMAPFAVDALAGRCAPHLPAGSFLVTGAGALTQRLRTESADRAGSAAETLQRIMGAQVPPMKDGQALLQVVGEMGTGLMVANLKPADCAEVSAMVEALAPLPTRNVGMLFSSIAGLAGRAHADATAKAAAADKGGKKKKTGSADGMDFVICKDG